MRYVLDRSYRWRGMKIRIPLFAISLFVFYQAFRSSQNTSEAVWGWILAFVAVVILGLIFEAKLKRTYKCPACSKDLGKPRTELIDGREEYVYDCPACEITWRTMTYVPENDG